MLRWDDRDVEVIVPRAGGRAIDGIRAHRCALDPRDVWTRDDIRVTSPARTILDVASSMAFKPLRRLVRQALAEQHVNVRQLLDVAAPPPAPPRRREAPRRHRRRARRRPRAASRTSRSTCSTRAGVNRPEVNPKLRLDGRDDPTPTCCSALTSRPRRSSCDSRRWHHDPLTQQDDADKQAILEAHGYRVLRITWRQIVDHPQQTLARIRAALGDA